MADPGVPSFVTEALTYIQDGTGQWIPATGSGGGGGGGDASAANQVIGNASLTSIDGKTPALVSGRQPVDPSGVTSPVSLASVPSHPVTNAGTFPVQVTSAPTTPVTGTFFQVTQPVSGTVATAKTALTASAPTQVSVGTASGQAVAANAARKGLVLVNTSANSISLGFGSAAVSGRGITLNANGGSFSMDEYSFTTAAVNAIASGAASNLAIQEFTT